MFKQITDFKKKANIQDNNEQLVVFWALRLFNYPPYYSHLKKTERRRFRRSSFEWEEFLTLVGYEFDDDLEEQYRVNRFSKIAIRLEKKFTSEDLSYSTAMQENLNSFTELLGLTAVDKAILGFFSILNLRNEFNEISQVLGELSNYDLIELLSYLLSLPFADVKEALSPLNVLSETGLLRVDPRAEDLQSKVDLISGLAANLCSQSLSSLSLLDNYFHRTTAAQLSLQDFYYLKEDNHLVGQYLSDDKNRGLNVLLYGEPGTGKTQWVKAIADKFERTLYEISDKDEEGEPMHSRERILAYKMAQSALKNVDNSVLIFDEIEDVFPELNQEKYKTSKSWMNKLIENSETPTFWICNDITHIDNAYIRRFDYTIELNTPPAEVIEKIFHNALTGINVSDKWISMVSKHTELVPGVIQRSADFLKTSLKCDQDSEIEELLVSIINRTLKAQKKKLLTTNKQKIAADYSLDYVNSDTDLSKLVQGIKAMQEGRLCLYGLPGTGKTAFGHFLAKELNKPLVLKKASDLLSKYVGDSEKNIADVFAEAQQTNSVLQIDEADSFIRSREGAQQSWEVTQVNEFLTQLENFDGVFIASTNLMDNIDDAAMRRFDLKIEFKPLTIDASLALLKDMVERHDGQLEEQSPSISKLKQLTQLTPGDFATVERKLRFSGGVYDSEVVVLALESECKFKKSQQNNNKIGFV